MGLKLNKTPTELGRDGSDKVRHRPTSTSTTNWRLASGWCTSTSGVVKRDLGIYIDFDLMMRTHVQQLASRCFAALRQLRQICRCVSADMMRSLVFSLVLPRVDYSNSVLVGLPAYLTRRLQSVLNVFARLVCNLRRYDGVTDALGSLHWLRIQERVKYKLAVLTHKVLHGTAPATSVRETDMPGRQALRFAGTNRLVVPSVTTADFWQPSLCSSWTIGI